MKKCMRYLLVFSLTSAMIFNLNCFCIFVEAAKKDPQIGIKKVVLNKGESKKVTIKNRPSNAKIVWLSKNKKIATVKKGKIKAINVGNTKVKVKLIYKKGKKKVIKKFVIKVIVSSKDAENIIKPEVPIEPSPTVSTSITLSLSGEGVGNNASYGNTEEEVGKLKSLSDDAVLEVKYYNTTTYPSGEAIVIDVATGGAISSEEVVGNSYSICVPVTSSGDGGEFIGINQIYTITIGELRQKLLGELEYIYIRSSWWCTSLSSVQIYPKSTK